MLLLEFLPPGTAVVPWESEDMQVMRLVGTLGEARGLAAGNGLGTLTLRGLDFTGAWRRFCCRRLTSHSG